MSAFSYISAKDLSTKLRDGASVTVVDVRDEDRAGGHIRGSVHVPAHEFQREVPRFLSQSATKEAVVFHCMMSQMRGPRCALAFAKAVEDAVKKGDMVEVPQVLILEGGFREFARSYSKATKDLFEDFQPSHYGSTWERD